MVKFKQYTGEVIGDVIDGVISEEDGLEVICQWMNSGKKMNLN